MEYSLLNPNQLRNVGVTVQDNPFADAPLYISTENGHFVLSLEILGTNIVAETRTPTERELKECRQIVMSSPHAWNPHQVRFPQSSRSMEEEMTMQRNLSDMSQYAYVVSEEVDRVRTYDLDAMQLRLIASVNVTDTNSRKIAQVEVADVPAAKAFVSHCPWIFSEQTLPQRLGCQLKENLKNVAR